MSGLNKDDIIRMARETDLLATTEPNGYQVWIPENLERFANLVIAARCEACETLFNERVLESIRFNADVRKFDAAIKAEREACALAAEAVVPRHTECGNKIAAAIRARGQG